MLYTQLQEVGSFPLKSTNLDLGQTIRQSQHICPHSLADNQIPFWIYLQCSPCRRGHIIGNPKMLCIRCFLFVFTWNSGISQGTQLHSSSSFLVLQSSYNSTLHLLSFNGILRKSCVAVILFTSVRVKSPSPKLAKDVKESIWTFASILCLLSLARPGL